MHAVEFIGDRSDNFLMCSCMCFKTLFDNVVFLLLFTKGELPQVEEIQF